MLHGFPESLNKDVVAPAALAIHADLDFVLFKHADEGGAAELAALTLSEGVRDQLPNLRLQINAGAGSFKSQFKKADKSGALYALILGDDELAQQVVGVKPLRGQGEQQTIAWDALAEHLATCIVQG